MSFRDAISNEFDSSNYKYTHAKPVNNNDDRVLSLTHPLPASFSFMTMKFFNWLLLIPSVALPVLAQKPPENLVIESYHKPADCSVKAKIGDSIRVHYVRSTSPHSLLFLTSVFLT
jgi:hypothetical protein